MPNITTSVEDYYMCLDWKLPINKTHFITSFEALIDFPDVHHLLFYLCSSGLPNFSSPQSCSKRKCESKKILFAWAQNAPPTNLPSGVGFKLMGDHKEYLILEVHYRLPVTRPDHTGFKIKLTDQPQLFSAGVSLYALSILQIPPNKEQILSSISCSFDSPFSLNPFAFRVHTHTLGRVISAYRVRGQEVKLIGKGNPQWPQAFWPITEKDVEVRKGDVVVIRCVFSSKGVDHEVYIGETHYDEMCNFYLMYSLNSSQTTEEIRCLGDNFPDKSKLLPPEANQPLPPNPILDALAKNNHPHHHHDNQISEYKHVDHRHAGHNEKQDQEEEKEEEEEEKNESPVFLSINPLSSFPLLPPNFKLGQVTGLAAKGDFLYVLHRGSRVWDENSFYSNNSYAGNKNSPIKEPTILKIRMETGKVEGMAGRNIFYMPHGIFVDSNNFIWITDVALHQVFKLPQDIFSNSSSSSSSSPPSSSSSSSSSPSSSSSSSSSVFLLSLGSPFSPGSDHHHFCKPSDVVLNSLGDIFISDGYCNNRVIIFDRLGVFSREILIGKQFSLPHSISIDEKNSLIFVSQRLTPSISVWNYEGNLIKQIESAYFNPEIFSNFFNPKTGFIYSINGDLSQPTEPHVIIMDPKSEKIISFWNIGVSECHDLVVSDNGNFLFIGDLKNRIFKYVSNNNNYHFGTDKYYRKIENKVHFHTQANHHHSNLAPNNKAAILILIIFSIFPIIVFIFVCFYVKKMKKINKFNYKKLNLIKNNNRANEEKKRMKNNNNNNNNNINNNKELNKLNNNNDDDDDDEDDDDDVVYSVNE